MQTATGNPLAKCWQMCIREAHELAKNDDSHIIAFKCHAFNLPKHLRHPEGQALENRQIMFMPDQ